MLFRNRTTRNAQTQKLTATLKRIQKLIRKLPKSHPFKETFVKLMAGEQVFCDDVTPFLNTLSLDRRARNLSLLTVWALGIMDMDNASKKLATMALIRLAEKELVPSSRNFRLRCIRYSISLFIPYIMCSAIEYSLRPPTLPSPPPHLSDRALDTFFAHQNAIENTYMLQLALFVIAAYVAFMLFDPGSLIFSGINFCQQLYSETGISLIALDQPESTSLRVLWSLRGGVRSNKVHDGMLKSGRLQQSRSELIISMMNVVSSENKGQLGLHAMERLSALLLKLDYVSLGVTDTPVALSILQALYRAGDSRAIPAVKTVLKRTKDPGLRLAAQQTLEVLQNQHVGNENLLHVTDAHSADTLLRVGTVDTSTHVDLLKPTISTNEETVNNTPAVILGATTDEQQTEFVNRIN